MTEQDFQQNLRLALTRAKVPVRLWRQPAGRIRTDRDTFVECAPVGAADLTGGVTGGLRKGTRVEIEVKGARTATTDAPVRERMPASPSVRPTRGLSASSGCQAISTPLAAMSNWSSAG